MLVFQWLLILYIINILSGITVTDISGSISYSTTSSNDYNIWTIAPTAGTKSIMLVFNQIQMQQAQMQIYDTINGASGTSLFSCSSCGNLLPPLFFSLTNSVTMYIRAVSSASFVSSSFSIQYFSILRYPSLANALSSAIAFNLNMGYAKIIPPLIGGTLLPAKLKFLWYINVNDASKITFSLSNYYFGNLCSSNLFIYNGLQELPSQLIYSGCTQADFPYSWIYANSGQALVVLQGGSRSQNVSFQITYYADTELYHCGSLVQPDVLGDNSMIITDGSKSSNAMRRSDSCTWLISPAQSGNVALLMRWVSIKSGATVNVYDGTSTNGLLLWGGQGPSTVTPPPIVSTRGSLYVTYSSNTQLTYGYLGFEGEYRAVGGPGLGSSQEYLTMSSALSITPSWYSRSNATVIAAAAPPLYTWYLQPSSASGCLLITFSSLLLLSRDNLTVYDGPTPSAPVLWRATGPSKAAPTFWLRASSLFASIQLQTRPRHSDLSHVSGFDMSFYSDGANYHCGFTTNPSNISAPSMVLSDGSPSTSAMYYNQACEWQIVVPGSRGIYIFFNRFDLRGASIQLFSGIRNDKNLVASISNSAYFPSPISILSSAYTTITFQSNALLPSGTNVLGQGFQLTYFSILPTHSGPGDGIVLLHSCFVASVSLPPSYSTANLSSPLLYDTRANMTWTIDLSWASVSSNLFLSFAYASFPRCTVSFLSITYNSSKHVICGRNSTMMGSKWIALQMPSTVTIQYVSLQAPPMAQAPNSMPAVGFDLSYYADGPNYNCGIGGNPTKLKTQSMVFSDGSPSLENMYPSQLCEWIISPLLTTDTSNVQRTVCRPSVIVTLEFLSNDLRGAAIEVYDGSDDSAPLLWRCVDCIVIPKPLLSASGIFFVRFQTQSRPRSLLGLGFQASYWTMKPLNCSDGIASELSASRYQLLDMPQGFSFTPSNNFSPNKGSLKSSNSTNSGNVTTAWKLTASAVPSSLTYRPYVQVYSVQNLEDSYKVYDGRLSQLSYLYRPEEALDSICGIVSSVNASYLTDPALNYKAFFSPSSYLLSDVRGKSLLSINLTEQAGAGTSGVPPFLSSSNCIYNLESSHKQRALTIRINKFKGSEGGMLSIYTGQYGYDNLAFYSELEDLRDNQVTAPCGIATIALQSYNASLSMNRNRRQVPASLGIFELDISYMEIASDDGQLCRSYSKLI